MTSAIPSLPKSSLFQSRLIKHASFWLAYYLLFSLIWASPTRSLYASFYLEFVLMPLRILASYCMMYLLVPALLSNRRISAFVLSYLALITIAGGLQLLVGHFFYDQLLSDRGERFPLSISSWMRSMVLINSTVILLGAAKVIQLHFQLLDSLANEPPPDPEQSEIGSDEFLEVKSNRKTHRLRIDDILYLEGLGNYVTYVSKEDRRTVVYQSLKAAQTALPNSFIRLHRSFLVNRMHIDTYDKDSVAIGSKTIPRGKDISDELLTGEI